MPDGTHWFPAVDVCRELGYSNSRTALLDHVPEQHRDILETSRVVDGMGLGGYPDHPAHRLLQSPDRRDSATRAHGPSGVRDAGTDRGNDRPPRGAQHKAGRRVRGRTA
ncbi:Bro-N domain-containing protein [Streptomyces sp. NBC_00466]|uniref:BRO-N domain-containing protein n=1 Tax=Streptomyces sp. NBC_00466 TaxID=2903655 RepID=UPI0030E13147